VSHLSPVCAKADVRGHGELKVRGHGELKSQAPWLGAGAAVRDQDAGKSAAGWGTWIRTKTNRVRVCCATVTPFPIRA
jgi:hypothetical protein